MRRFSIGFEDPNLVLPAVERLPKRARLNVGPACYTIFIFLYLLVYRQRHLFHLHLHTLLIKFQRDNGYMIRSVTSNSKNARAFIVNFFHTKKNVTYRHSLFIVFAITILK